MKKLFILLAAFAVGCGNDDGSSQPGKTDMKLVTGVSFRQNFDDPGLELGNPNTFVDNKFLIYPNPVNEVVMIISDESISDVWIVPATANKIYQDEDFAAVLDSGLYNEQSVDSNADIAINSQSSENLEVDISSLDKGYYRVFVKIGGQLYWDNLYKYDNSGNEQQFMEIMEFWD